jgi:putative transposase
VKKSRFTDEQIIAFLKQAESGVAVKDPCRKHGFSDASFYKWRSRLGGLEVSEVRRLRDLETRNSKLKKLLAEAKLDIEALKVVARGKR